MRTTTIILLSIISFLLGFIITYSICREYDCTKYFMKE